MPEQRILRGAAAGAIAAGVWAAQEPLDMRAFGVDYSDRRLVTLPGHLANGAVLGAIYSSISPRVHAPGALKGAAAGMAEHLATWPLTRFIPRVKLWGNRRAFWQAVWRHLLFGVLLGALEERLNRGYADDAPA